MLVVNATPSSTALRAGREGLACFELRDITVDETELRYVSAWIDWGNGRPPTHLGAGGISPTPLAVEAPISIPRASMEFRPGTYLVSITARNYRQPRHDQAQKFFQLIVKAEAGTSEPARKLTGPILPKDEGFPNAEQWNFHVGEGLEVLASSVKSILLTAKGERLMNPNFGTGLQKVLFEPDTGAVESLVRENIARAVAEFEPRVALETLSVERVPNGRRVIVRATFLSKLDGRTFEISTPYELKPV